MPTSPTQRTMKVLREQGFTVDVVEQWKRNPKHPAGGYRRDYLHIIDILAISFHHTVGIQACGSDFAVHWRKLTIEEAENSFEWLSRPSRTLEIWSWRKVKVKRGGKAMRWQPRVVAVTLADLEQK